MGGKPAYVVFRGRIPGVYETWDECNSQVWKYEGASFRKYASRAEAESAYVLRPATWENLNTTSTTIVGNRTSSTYTWNTRSFLLGMVVGSVMMLVAINLFGN